MAHLSPLRTDDTPVLLLAALAALTRLPPHATASLRRDNLVQQLLKRGEVAPLSPAIVDALTDELLQLSKQFPTFDALLLAYDTAVTAVTHMAAGLAIAIAAGSTGVPLFIPQTDAGGQRQIAG